MHTPPPRGHSKDTFAHELSLKYPYFVPARYIQAAQQHQDYPLNEKMLSEIYPYAGNWLQLCDHLSGVEDGPGTLAVEDIEFIPSVSMVEEISTTGDTMSHITEEDKAAVADAEEEEYSEENYVTEAISDDPIHLSEVEDQMAAHEQETLIEEPITHTEVASPIEDDLISPVYTEDYFMQQGVKISAELPEDIIHPTHTEPAASAEESEEEKAKSLMVMMSFTEWLLHFRNTAEKQIAEAEDKKAIRTMWQKEKLAAAMEEENDEIPENVFEMAVNSITSEDGLASESLAEIYTKQQKYDKAVEMYRKLSLRNPQKSAYFARKIEEVLKEKQL